MSSWLGHDLRPNVRHWLQKISREIVKQWKKATEKWREPWTHEQGSIEILDGEIVFADGKRLKARFSLWFRYRSGPSDLNTWGGVAEYSQSQFPSHLGGDEIVIQIPGRPPASALVSESKWSGSAGAKLVLHANSPYPAAARDETAEGESSLVDVVAKIIRDTGVGLTQEEAELASKRLQPLLERADMSLFSTHPQYDAGVRMKLACQEAALVTRTLAESLPRTFQSSVALWRIANSILEKESLALRLSPAELDRLGELARLGALESPDELLFWMIDRVKDEPSREATRYAARTALNSI
jgi:hypothetical protein